MSGSVTDVPGIQVGHAQRTGCGWLTGVTVVLPPPGTVGSVDVRGGGPGTHETDALEPTTLVPTVDAVCLTGGSAYGLAAAHGVQRWCEEHGRGFPVPGGVVPIVPTAAIFDLGRGGDFGARPDADMGHAAAVAAAASPVRNDAGSGNDADSGADARPGTDAGPGGDADPGNDAGRGNVGAGTGAVIDGGRFKGGTGSSSARLSGPNGSVVVGALAVVNALGAPLTQGVSGGDGGLGNEERAHRDQDGALQGWEGPAGHRGRTAGAGMGLNTTLVVVATNAILDPAQCKRTAAAAHAGLARALSPVHTLADGDTIFALATGAEALAGEGAAVVPSLMELQNAAAEVTREAVLDAVAAAQPVQNEAVNLPTWT